MAEDSRYSQWTKAWLGAVGRGGCITSSEGSPDYMHRCTHNHCMMCLGRSEQLWAGVLVQPMAMVSAMRWGSETAQVSVMKSVMVSALTRELVSAPRCRCMDRLTPQRAQVQNTRS